MINCTSIERKTTHKNVIAATTTAVWEANCQQLNQLKGIQKQRD